MTKLYTVGCSQTRYHWPTWADILGRSFDHFENWGHSGVGNRAIFERTVEMIHTSDPTPDDLIMIQWSNPYRFDAHKVSHDLPLRWSTAGNIANWPPQLAETIYCEFSYVYHTCNFITACKNLLENKKLKYVFLSMNDLEKYFSRFEELDIYQKELKNIDWMPPLFDWFVEQKLPTKTFEKKDFIQLTTLKDEHPTPFSHYLYLEKFLPKELGIDLDQAWAEAADEIVFKSKGYKEMFDNFKQDLDWVENQNVMRGL